MDNLNSRLLRQIFITQISITQLKFYSLFGFKLLTNLKIHGEKYQTSRTWCTKCNPRPLSPPTVIRHDSFIYRRNFISRVTFVTILFARTRGKRRISQCLIFTEQTPMRSRIFPKRQDRPIRLLLLWIKSGSVRRVYTRDPRSS